MWKLNKNKGEVKFKVKVSFIVTVYNRLEYLRNIVKSLINQTEQPDELIIADDGSSEKVMDFIGDLLADCKFKIKHIYQEDKGFRKSKSCNNAVREAEGELIIFADQDVIFGKNYIKTIVKKARKGHIHPHKVIWSNFDEKLKIQKLLDDQNEYRKILNVIAKESKYDTIKQNRKDFIRAFKFRYKLRKKTLTLGGASFSIFKDDYMKVNGYDEDFKGHGGEDTDFGYRLQKYGINPKIILFDELPIHMAHSKDPTAGSNKEKIEKMGKDETETISEYGINNPKDLDLYTVTILKN